MHLNKSTRESPFDERDVCSWRHKVAMHVLSQERTWIERSEDPESQRWTVLAIPYYREDTIHWAYWAFAQLPFMSIRLGSAIQTCAAIGSQAEPVLYPRQVLGLLPHSYREPLCYWCNSLSQHLFLFGWHRCALPGNGRSLLSWPDRVLRIALA